MSEENLYTFEKEEYRKTYWHTCSHVMAQAVKRLWPETKLAIGPAIDNGFYYDLDSEKAFTPEDLEKIEAEMRKICKEKLKLERFELPRAEALKLMEEQGEPYKVELINDLPEDAHISFYKQGEFTDLCAGPHLDSTGRVKGNAIKLTAVLRRVLAGRLQPGDAPAHLRRGLPQEGGAGRVSGSSRREAPQAGPQQAGPGAGVLHHGGCHRPGPAGAAAQGRQQPSRCSSAGWRTRSSKRGYLLTKTPLDGQAGAL